MRNNHNDRHRKLRKGQHETTRIRRLPLQCIVVWSPLLLAIAWSTHVIFWSRRLLQGPEPLTGSLEYTQRRIGAQVPKTLDAEGALHGQGDAFLSDIDVPTACRGKEAYLRLIMRATDGLSKYRNVTHLCQELPLVTKVHTMYGSRPIVYGLDTCQAYRHRLMQHNNQPPMPRVAGLYNTGTNLLARLLELNLPKTWQDDRSASSLPRRGPSPLNVPVRTKL